MTDHQDACALVEVCGYSIASLKNRLSRYSEAKADDIDLKLHSIYFKDYFKEIGAKTIVIEGPYVDHDYLDDHAQYYLKCFRHIKKSTHRFHFFNIDFDQDQFFAGLSNSKEQEFVKTLNAAYLGFIVVKPLAKTIIGRTCLKTYDDLSGERCYPIKRTYEVNLFGLPLTVDSLAFEEQDSVVAACATSALWSSFHATGKLFQHPIPSPSAITQLATESSPLDRRRFPNRGLTIEQMAHAIASVGLAPEPVNATDVYILKATVCAYLSAEIPLILGGSLIDTSIDDKIFGMHGVTIVGYRIDDALPIAGKLPLKAEQISKLYVHDDQVGPFSRIEFDLDAIDIYDLDIDEKIENVNVLSTYWQPENESFSVYDKKVKFYPEVLLLPLYPKIRIPFEKVMEPLAPFNEFLVDLQNQGNLPVTEKIEWKVQLSAVNKMKSEFNDDTTKNGDMVRLMLKPCPRFLWRATAFQKDAAIFELLFDATDIEQTGFYFDSVSYDQSTLEVIAELSKEEAIRNLAKPEIRYLLEHLAKRT